MHQEQSNMASKLNPQKQAEILKDQGNMCFKKDRLAAAIEAYTQVHASKLRYFRIHSVLCSCASLTL